MDKDRIVGSGKQIKGTVKEVVGKAVGELPSWSPRARLTR